MKLDEGDIVAEVRGNVVKDGRVLRISRIDVHFQIRAPEEKRDTISRVRSFYVDHCPVARTLQAGVEIVTEFELV